MKKTWVRFILVLLITFVFLYFFLRKVEWKEVFNYLDNINIPLFILVVVLVPVHFVTRALRWKYLLVHEKKGVKFYNMFAGNVLGFTVTFLLPGRLGELAKPLYLAKKENMSKGFVMGTVVVERVFDIFTMCFLLGLFLISRPLYASYFQGKKETFSNLYRLGLGGVALASLILFIILSLYFFKEKSLSFISKILKFFPRKLSEKVLELFREFIQGLKFFHSLGNLLIYILLSFVVWLGVISYFWLFCFAYNISVPYFFLIPYTFLTMVGASIPTPGMVGGFHYFSKLGLTSLFNIDTNLAVGMTIVIHVIQFAVTCLLGYGILWKESISIFQLKKLGENIKK